MVVIAWLVWLVATYFIANFLVAGVFSILPENIFANETIMYFVLYLAVYTLMLLVGLGAPYLVRYKLNLPSFKKILGLERKPKLGDFGRALSFALLYFVILFTVMLPLNFLFPDLMSQEQEIGFSISDSSPLALVGIFLTLVVLAPISEELLMRGLFFNRLRSRLSFFWASFLVSLAFAVAHWQPNVGIDTFILSMVLCCAREETGAIYTSILIHALKNSVAFSALLLI